MRKNKRERGLECAPASFANSDSSSMQPPFALKPAASAASAADDDLVIFSEEDNRGFHKPVLYPLSSLLTSSEFEFRRNPKIKEGREAISTLSRRVDSGFSSQSASEVLQSTPSESYRKVKEEQLLEVASSSTLTRRVDGGFHSSQSTRESSEVSKDPSVALNDEKCKRAKAQRLNYTAGAPMAEETLSSAMELELLSTEELNMECERDGVVKARYLLTERMYRKQSEDHEEELSRKWDTLELEHNDLKEKYKKLLQETQLKETWQIDVASQLSQIDAKQELELVTTLFSCQARDFSVIRLFASGCEGAVFLAKCTNRRLHRFKHKVFALKVLFNIFSYSTYTKVRSYYKSEYDVLSSLPRHNNIVRLYAFFYDRIDPSQFPDLPPEVAEEARALSLFLVLEDHPSSLDAVAESARQENKLTVRKVLQWTFQILRGVNHLSENFVVHRDLKLNNILVSDDGTLKICDFGTAIELDDQMKLLHRVGGSLGGNPAHMAPEILNASPNSLVDCSRQDVWAVGVLIHEICGQRPFAKLDQRGYKTADIPKLPRLDRDFPREFCALVNSLLDFKLVLRPSADVAVSKIETLL
ncbi:cyclin-dependent kinase 11B-like [Oscarella lobularis]|uniref:cyclin-dependent kinase 11B-like n=1 Tax=Oscarella lobularis TaxID=121494 RepID=UPI00331358C5